MQGYDKCLPDQVLKDLIPGLKNIPTSRIYIAYYEKEYAGMAVCFISFSTFYAKPLINIHDIMVMKEFRGNGMGTFHLRYIEKTAFEMNCCKACP